LEINQG